MGGMKVRPWASLETTQIQEHVVLEPLRDWHAPYKSMWFGLTLMEFPCKPQILNYPLVGITFGEGNGTPLQYSCLENPVDRGAWSMGSQRVRHDWATSLSFFTFHFHALEKEMATHSSVLAWRIPGMGEPGGLPSMGSDRVRHNWSNLAAAAAGKTFIGDMLVYSEYPTDFWQ